MATIQTIATLDGSSSVNVNASTTKYLLKYTKSIITDERRQELRALLQQALNKKQEEQVMISKPLVEKLGNFKEQSITIDGQLLILQGSGHIDSAIHSSDSEESQKLTEEDSCDSFFLFDPTKPMQNSFCLIKLDFVNLKWCFMRQPDYAFYLSVFKKYSEIIESINKQYFRLYIKKSDIDNILVSKQIFQIEDTKLIIKIKTYDNDKKFTIEPGSSPLKVFVNNCDDCTCVLFSNLTGSWTTDVHCQIPSINKDLPNECKFDIQSIITGIKTLEDLLSQLSPSTITSALKQQKFQELPLKLQQHFDLTEVINTTSAEEVVLLLDISGSMGVSSFYKLEASTNNSIQQWCIQTLFENPDIINFLSNDTFLKNRFFNAFALILKYIKDIMNGTITELIIVPFTKDSASPNVKIIDSPDSARDFIKNLKIWFCNLATESSSTYFSISDEILQKIKPDAELVMISDGELTQPFNTSVKHLQDVIDKCNRQISVYITCESQNTEKMTTKDAVFSIILQMKHQLELDDMMLFVIPYGIDIRQQTFKQINIDNTSNDEEQKKETEVSGVTQTPVQHVDLVESKKILCNGQEITLSSTLEMMILFNYCVSLGLGQIYDNLKRFVEHARSIGAKDTIVNDMVIKIFPSITFTKPLVEKLLKVLSVLPRQYYLNEKLTQDEFEDVLNELVQKQNAMKASLSRTTSSAGSSSLLSAGSSSLSSAVSSSLLSAGSSSLLSAGSSSLSSASGTDFKPQSLTLQDLFRTIDKSKSILGFNPAPGAISLSKNKIELDVALSMVKFQCGFFCIDTSDIPIGTHSLVLTTNYSRDVKWRCGVSYLNMQPKYKESQIAELVSIIKRLMILEGKDMTVVLSNLKQHTDITFSNHVSFDKTMAKSILVDGDNRVVTINIIKSDGNITLELIRNGIKLCTTSRPVVENDYLILTGEFLPGKITLESPLIDIMMKKPLNIQIEQPDKSMNLRRTDNNFGILFKVKEFKALSVEKLLRLQLGENDFKVICCIPGEPQQGMQDISVDEFIRYAQQLNNIEKFMYILLTRILFFEDAIVLSWISNRTISIALTRFISFAIRCDMKESNNYVRFLQRKAIKQDIKKTHQKVIDFLGDKIPQQVVDISTFKQIPEDKLVKTYQILNDLKNLNSNLETLYSSPLISYVMKKIQNGNEHCELFKILLTLPNINQFKELVVKINSLMEKVIRFNAVKESLSFDEKFIENMETITRIVNELPQDENQIVKQLIKLYCQTEFLANYDIEQQQKLVQEIQQRMKDIKLHVGTCSGDKPLLVAFNHGFLSGKKLTSYTQEYINGGGEPTFEFAMAGNKITNPVGIWGSLTELGLRNIISLSSMEKLNEKNKDNLGATCWFEADANSATTNLSRPEWSYFILGECNNLPLLKVATKVYEEIMKQLEKQKDFENYEKCKLKFVKFLQICCEMQLFTSTEMRFDMEDLMWSVVGSIPIEPKKKTSQKFITTLNCMVCLEDGLTSDNLSEWFSFPSNLLEPICPTCCEKCVRTQQYHLKEFAFEQLVELDCCITNPLTRETVTLKELVDLRTERNCRHTEEYKKWSLYVEEIRKTKQVTGL
jgi:hypothetical protein